MTEINYKTGLRSKMITMIINDLTIGLTDQEAEPFTMDKINEFIMNNNDNIEKAIARMITEYIDDDDEENLTNPLMDWVGEYLYLYVDPYEHLNPKIMVRVDYNLAISAYYELTHPQYNRLKKWYDGGFQSWVFDEYLTITESDIKITMLDSDPILSDFIRKYKNPCKLLENIPGNFIL